MHARPRRPLPLSIWLCVLKIRRFLVDESRGNRVLFFYFDKEIGVFPFYLPR